jgi:hypothetical protein
MNLTKNSLPIDATDAAESQAVKRLVIGKNAQLVRRIKSQLSGCTCISHRDIDQLDTTPFDAIFVFSWDRAGLKGNEDLLAALPPGKVVFVSTTAVLALQRRRQWNRYPNDKHHIEQQVLKRGGRVLRIGITEPDHAAHLTGCFPFTSIDLITDAILNWHNITGDVVDLFQLRNGELRGLLGRVSHALGRLSGSMPPGAAWQIPIQGVARLIGLRSYGYTADANASFADEIVVGYGALGSYYDRSNPSTSRLVLVSGRPDESLNDRGFRNTRVGLGLIGLSRLWHGADVSSPSGAPPTAQKHVPLWVKRPRLPHDRHAIAHVISAFRLHGFWRVEAKASGDRPRVFYSRRLTLAAGPLENTRILAKLRPIDCSFSDHEIGMIGRCPAASAIRIGAIVPVGPFWRRGRVIVDTADGIPFLVEMRPLVPAKHAASASDIDFYLDSTQGLLVKLIKGFSPSRLNEAVFNKFGWGLRSASCSVFVQALAKEAVRFTASRSADGLAAWSRQRLTTSAWSCIQKTIAQRVSEFAPESTVTTIDAQHILGGDDLRRDDVISEWCGQGALRILGSPTLDCLGPFHHTRRLQEAIARE